MKFALPSRWGLKLVDALAILILISLLLKFIAPTSGFAIWLTQGWNIAGAALTWFFGGIAKLFHAL